MWPRLHMALAVDGTLNTSKLDYCTSQIAYNNGADQTAQMRRLICAFVIHMFSPFEAHIKILILVTQCQTSFRALVPFCLVFRRTKPSSVEKLTWVCLR